MITIGQFIDNMERNGYEQAFGYMIDDSRFPSNACALGQGILNTDWTGYSTYIYLPRDFAHWVMERNDADKWPISKIAQEARSRFKHRLDDVITPGGFISNSDILIFSTYPDATRKAG